MPPPPGAQPRTNHNQRGNTMGEWISPNEAVKRASDLMLDGREPESYDDWILVVNCWAANGLDEAVIQLMRVLYDIPVTEQDVIVIVRGHEARLN